MKKWELSKKCGKLQKVVGLYAFKMKNMNPKHLSFPVGLPQPG
jgi:hypothetical protein